MQVAYDHVRLKLVLCSRITEASGLEEPPAGCKPAGIFVECWAVHVLARSLLSLRAQAGVNPLHLVLVIDDGV